MDVESATKTLLTLINTSIVKGELTIASINALNFLTAKAKEAEAQPK